MKFDKNTLTEIASLGAGAVAGAYVSQKVLTKADGSYLIGTGKTGQVVADAAPILVGLFLQGQKNGMLKEAGKGMIAQAAGSLIKTNVIPNAGIKGYAEGESVMMNGTDGLDTGVDNPMISAIPSNGGEDYDFSTGAAGEAAF